MLRKLPPTICRSLRCRSHTVRTIILSLDFRGKSKNNVAVQDGWPSKTRSSGALCSTGRVPKQWVYSTSKEPWDRKMQGGGSGVAGPRAAPRSCRLAGRRTAEREAIRRAHLENHLCNSISKAYKRVRSFGIGSVIGLLVRFLPLPLFILQR